MPQQLFSLWTVPTDDVTGRANASEEVRVDCWSGGSRGNIGQVHIHSDFPSRGRLGACDRRERKHCWESQDSMGTSAHACKFAKTSEVLSHIYLYSDYIPGLDEDFAGADLVVEDVVRVEETFTFTIPLWFPVLLLPEPDLWVAWWQRFT